MNIATRAYWIMVLTANRQIILTDDSRDNI